MLVISYRLLFMCFFNFVMTDLFELLSMHPSFTNGTFGLSNGAFWFIVLLTYLPQNCELLDG